MASSTIDWLPTKRARLTRPRAGTPSDGVGQQGRTGQAEPELECIQRGKPGAGGAQRAQQIRVEGRDLERAVFGQPAGGDLARPPPVQLAVRVREQCERTLGQRLVEQQAAHRRGGGERQREPEGEAAIRSAPAALEALAITARTFALANLRRHGAHGFDLCELTHCQVTRPATAATRRAARRDCARARVS